MTWLLTQPDPRMSKLILSLFPVEPTGKGLRSFDILGSGCVSSMYGSSVQPIPNKSYETLHREALTDPSLKNITTFVTAITASPLWEGWKMQPDINAGKTVGNTHSRRDQAQSRLNVFGGPGPARLMGPLSSLWPTWRGGGRSTLYQQIRQYSLRSQSESDMMSNYDLRKGA